MKKWKIALSAGSTLIIIVIAIVAVLSINGVWEEDRTKYRSSAYDSGEWINLSSLSDEFFAKFFSEYAEIHNNYDQENILLVMSHGRPSDYGAVQVVEAPNNTWFLQYATEEDRDRAYNELKQNKNILVDFNEFNDTIQQNGIVGISTTPCDYQSPDCHMSWGATVMGLDVAIDTVNELGNAPEVKVAVIDTGIDSAVFNKYYPGRLETICISGGGHYDPYYEEDGSFKNKYMYREGSDTCIVNAAEITDIDINGHGTHVAGIVADGTPSTAKVIAIQVSYSYDKPKKDKDGNLVKTEDGSVVTEYTTSSSDTDMIASIYYAYCGKRDGCNPPNSGKCDAAAQSACGADVINISSGGYDNRTEAQKAAEPYKPAKIAALDSVTRQGVVVVAAAGNDGNKDNDNGAKPIYPASYDSVISVSALEDSNGNLQRAAFSNHNQFVEFAAPGMAIVSLAASGDTKAMQGTSMASPHMAAAAAIIKSLNPNLSMYGVRQVLTEIAMDLGDAGRDEYYGHGVVDFRKAPLCKGDNCDERNGVLTFPGNSLSKRQDVETCFSDVDPSKFYAGAVKWSYYDRYGIYDGTPEDYKGQISTGTGQCTDGSGGEMSIDESVKRREAMVMLWRLAGSPTTDATGNSYSKYAETAFDYLCNPTDGVDIGENGIECEGTRKESYYMNAIGWATKTTTDDGTPLANGMEGVYEDRPVTYFASEDGLTRPQVITFLYRFYKRFYDSTTGRWRAPVQVGPDAKLEPANG